MREKMFVIFDFDGTIADTMGSIEKITNKLSDKFNFKKIKKADLEELKNKETKEIFKSLGIPLVQLPFVFKEVRKVLYNEIDEIKPIKEIKEALLQIKKNNYGLGILTSSPLKTVEKFLKVNKFDFFDFVYSEENLFKKDQKLEKLLKKKNLNPQKVFYVGDETRDIVAAKKVGVKAVAVNWGFNSEKILEAQKPDYLIKKPKDLIALFKNFL